MKHLTPEQKQACRDNPLAAYLAKRLPVMLVLVGIIVLCNLLSVGLVAFYSFNAGPLPGLDLVHGLAVSLTVTTLGCGVILALELLWMRRYQITPETFDPPRAEVRWPRTAPTTEEPRLPLSTLAEQLVSAARSEAAQHGRTHKTAGTRMEAEYRRSMEIQLFALADLVHAAAKSLEDKQELGYLGSNKGFRQLEATRELLQRVVRIAQAANRTLRAPNKNRLQSDDCRR